MSYDEKIHYLEHELNICERSIEIGEKLIGNNFGNYKNHDNYKELLETITRLRSDIHDQLTRLRKQYYEIAVVGREKAGKSSLINAWLHFDLLPSERQRCTYTTTEIRSCQYDSEQKYTIIYLTQDEFNQQIDKTRQALNALGSNNFRDKDLLQQELDEVENLKDSISKFLTGVTETRHFVDFSEVNDNLKGAIANPSQARAVKKVTIWTSKLTSHNNVVLHDVPGYDSPITLHKEQTRAKIANVDAVIYAKQFGSPDLVDSEVEIMKITDTNNQFIRTKDKMLVALTFFDLANSATEYEHLLSMHRKIWTSLGVGLGRIIPICSKAEMPSDSPECRTVHERIKDINNGKTGYDQLKTAVDSCVEDSKTVIAIERCNYMKTYIRSFCLKLSDFIKTDCNIDIDKQTRDDLGDIEMEKLCSEWWAKEWKDIKESFHEYFQSSVRPRLSLYAIYRDDKNEFKKIYEDSVDKIYKSIPAIRKERQKAIYISCTGDEGIIAPKEANNKIRTEIARDAMNNIDRITIDLCNYVSTNTNKIINWGKCRLWHIPDVKDEMLGMDEKLVEKIMRRSYDALIQRLVRPAIDLFLRYPRSKIERTRVMKEYELELTILDNFMVNGRIKRRGIVNFLANGVLAPFRLEVNNNIQDNAKDTNPFGTLGEFSYEPTKSPIQSDEKKKFNLFRKKTKNGVNNDDIVSMYSSTTLMTPMLKQNESVLLCSSDGKSQSSTRLRDMQFERINFSPDSSTLEEIQNEIADDFEEFLDCLKNSVYYGCGVQRLYNQELDVYRRRFIELEEEKRRWSHLVFKYTRNQNITDNASKIIPQIPSPRMQDETENRKIIAKGISELRFLVNSLK